MVIISATSNKNFDHNENNFIWSKAIWLTGKYFVEPILFKTCFCTKDWDFYKVKLWFLLSSPFWSIDQYFNITLTLVIILLAIYTNFQ